jgi:hypothetical protein
MWVRKNLLQQSDEEIEAMDKEMQSEQPSDTEKQFFGQPQEEQK